MFGFKNLFKLRSQLVEAINQNDLNKLANLLNVKNFVTNTTSTNSNQVESRRKTNEITAKEFTYSNKYTSISKANQYLEQDSNSNQSVSKIEKINESLTEYEFNQAEETTVKYLNLNFVDREGQTLLHRSCINGNLPIVMLLCEQGACQNIKNNDGWYPIHLASYYGHVQVVKYLIENQNSYEHSRIDVYDELDAFKGKVYDYTKLSKAGLNTKTSIMKSSSCRLGFNFNIDSRHYELLNNTRDYNDSDDETASSSDSDEEDNNIENNTNSILLIDESELLLIKDISCLDLIDCIENISDSICEKYHK
jgi:hypothetical protein